MKNKTGIIFLIILLSVIIFSLVMFLVRYLCGGEYGMISFGSNNREVIFNKTYAADEIQDIAIKQATGKIIFQESSTENFEVIIYGKDSNDVEVSINNRNLSIDYQEKHRFIWFGFGNFKNDIIVYVPTSYQNNITIKNDLGDCEIANLENASVDIDCNAGSVEMGKIKNANIQCDLGSVKVDEILNRCSISVDSGNVKIDKLFINENSFIKADLGNVTIKEINDIYVDAKVDLGNSSVNGSNRNSNVTLKIECDCGNIAVGNK